MNELVFNINDQTNSCEVLYFTGKIACSSSKRI